ncbi:unnamed protein product [Brugia pahangi]|uniref:Secreted protein n=1 Tax=Brugia pahangi TaxID=6280 RepID=A0A0N4TE83_BRUPA|nr:unnamed protein product [Brugia pahangi]
MRNRNRASNKLCWETGCSFVFWNCQLFHLQNLQSISMHGKTRTQYAHVCRFADALRVYPKCRCAISASGFTTQMVISRSSPGGLVVRDLLAGSGMTAVVA